mgnify:FL=1|jgi:hypothetical protein
MSLNKYMGNLTGNLIRYVVIFNSIILLYFLTKKIAHFFDLGIDVYGIYLIIGIGLLTLFAFLPIDITSVFKNVI